MNTSFCFIDEIGLSAGDRMQPFMALGLLKVQDVSDFTTELYKFHYSYLAYNATERKKLVNSLLEAPKELKFHELNNLFRPNRHHEFKYDSIGFPNLQKYKDLIGLIMRFDFEFDCVIVDKSTADFDIKKYGTYWHAYSKFLTFLLEKTCQNQKVIPIVDFLHKPNDEEDIIKILNKLNCVDNALQADSKSFPLLQITDLLLGAVVFEKKRSIGLFNKTSNKVLARIDFENHLKASLKLSCLYDTNLQNDQIKFNVWHSKA